MTSIFSNNSFFQKETEVRQQPQYSFGQAATSQFSSGDIDNCFDKSNQIQRQAQSSDVPSLSSLLAKSFFKDTTPEAFDEDFDTQACAQIESNILDMIDDEPVETSSHTEQADAKSEENNKQPFDIVEGGQKLVRQTSQELSPGSPSTQNSEGAYSNSIFSASSNNSIFQSPTFCQNTFQQDVKVQDFSQLLAQETEVKPSKRSENKASNFDFPEGGWECSQCSNYNFKGRKQCFRCKKDRDSSDVKGKPSHMNLSKEERVAQKAQRSQNKKQFQKKKTGRNNEKNESCQQRPGDWTCCKCQNFNYSFRDTCNKCGLLQQEHIYYSTNFTADQIDFSSITSVAQQAFNQPQGQLYYFDNQQMGQQQSNTQLFAMVVPPNFNTQQIQQWFPAC